MEKIIKIGSNNTKNNIYEAINNELYKNIIKKELKKIC